MKSKMELVPAEKNPKKLEEYELDNHVRTMQEASKIMGDKNLMKQVHKHAKKKKSELHGVSKMLNHNESMEPDAEEMGESAADEKKEIRSIDQIRARSKKLKSKMNKVE